MAEERKVNSQGLSTLLLEYLANLGPRQPPKHSSDYWGIFSKGKKRQCQGIICWLYRSFVQGFVQSFK